MNLEVKARWVAALRSGEYEQGNCQLNLQGRMCCLGVLCDLHAKETGAQWANNFCGGEFYLGEANYLPEPVQQWAGLPDRTGDTVTIRGEVDKLPAHNDSGRGFDEIADAIEEQL
jgi:hypothetical protein